MLKSLLSIRLRSFLAAFLGKGKNGEYKKSSVGKIILFAILFLYVGVVFCGMAIALAFGLGIAMIGTASEWLYFALFSLIAFALIFIFSIFETKTELFECRDNDLLLSLPIPPNKIVLCRILTVMIYNYAEAAVILFPMIVVYAIIGGSIFGIIGGILLYLTLPLIATALASAVGYLVARLTARFKNRSFVSLAVSLVFLGLYFFGYSKLMSGMEQMEENFDQVVDSLSSSLALLRGIGEAGMLRPLPTVILLLATALISGLAFLIISRSYIRIVTTKHGSARTAYREKKLEKKSALYALSVKELRRFLSSSTYMLNAGLGLIFELVLAILFLVRRESFYGMLDSMFPGLESLIPSLMIGVLAFVSLFNVISASALSLEGKSLWLIRSIPVTGREVLLAKAMPHIVVSLPFTWISAVLLAVGTKADALTCFFFFLLPTLACIAAALVGISFNLLMPKFDFVNEAQPVKQSLCVFVTGIVQFFFGAVLMIPLFVFGFLGLPAVGLVLDSVLTFGVCVLLFFLLTGPGSRRFERIYC